MGMRQRRLDTCNVTSRKYQFLLTQQFHLHRRCMAFLQKLVLATPSADQQNLEAKYCVLTYTSRKGLGPHRTPMEKRFTGYNAQGTVLHSVQKLLHIFLCTSVHLQSMV